VQIEGWRNLGPWFVIASAFSGHPLTHKPHFVQRSKLMIGCAFNAIRSPDLCNMDHNIAGKACIRQKSFCVLLFIQNHFVLRPSRLPDQAR
jgi:hypothetical protein